MPDGATERERLARIELHIAQTEERIAELSAEIDLLTPMEAQALHGEKMLLESLFERRQVILASWRAKHDPSRSQT